MAKAHEFTTNQAAYIELRGRGVGKSDAFRQAYPRHKSYPTQEIEKLERNERIAKAIERTRQKFIRQSQMNGNEILSQFAACGGSDMGNYFEQDASGEFRVIPLATMDPQHRRAIRKIIVNQKKRTDGSVDTNIVIELHDKLKALTALARNMGIEFPKDQQLMGAFDAGRITQACLEAGRLLRAEGASPQEVRSAIQSVLEAVNPDEDKEQE